MDVPPLGCTKRCGVAAEGAGDDEWLAGKISWVKVMVRQDGPIPRANSANLFPYSRIRPALEHSNEDRNQDANCKAGWK